MREPGAALQLKELVHGDPALPALLFLHGFLGNRKDWNPIVPYFTDRFCCICVDLPGHGGTYAPAGQAGYTLDAVCGALNALLDARGIARAGVAGYSMGGRVALYYALAHPERVTRLVLESASPGLKTEAERRQRRRQDALLAERLEAMPPESGLERSFVEDWYAQSLFASLAEKPELLPALIARRMRNKPARLARALRGLGTGAQPDLWPRLGELKPPALIVTGELDRKYRILAEEMSACSPRIAVETLTGCGHNVHLENPRDFATVVRAFFCPASGAGPRE